jgi:hypothetical protein
MGLAGGSDTIMRHSTQRYTDSKGHIAHSEYNTKK